MTPIVRWRMGFVIAGALLGMSIPAPAQGIEEWPRTFATTFAAMHADLETLHFERLGKGHTATTESYTYAFSSGKHVEFLIATATLEKTPRIARVIYAWAPGLDSGSFLHVQFIFAAVTARLAPEWDPKTKTDFLEKALGQVARKGKFVESVHGVRVEVRVAQDPVFSGFHELTMVPASAEKAQH